MSAWSFQSHCHHNQHESHFFRQIALDIKKYFPCFWPWPGSERVNAVVFFFTGLRVHPDARGETGQGDRVSEMPEVQSSRPQDQVGQGVQPRLRREVQDHLPPALQTRNKVTMVGRSWWNLELTFCHTLQVPHDLPDCVRQQWLPAGTIYWEMISWTGMTILVSALWKSTQGALLSRDKMP